MFGFFRLRLLDQQTVALTLAVCAALTCLHTVKGKQETIEQKYYTFRIDLSSATLGELQTLPGIGPKLAENIVQYRDQHAPIRNVDEILNVSGIGNKRYDAIKPYFTR